MALAHHDIFRHHLAIKYPVYGHALWEPSPGDSFPAVEIGDVGFTRDGRFHRLFNVLLPAEDPSHENYGVPEYHEQLTLRMRNHIIRGTLGPNNLCSARVTSQPVPKELAMGPDSPAEVVFSCKRKQGAVLYLPTEARCENTIALGDFGKWMIKHIDSWFSWIRLLGVGINRMEDVVLVTGTHRTRSWTNVAFPGGQVDGLVSFGANVATRGAVVTVNWKFSHEYSRGAVLNYGPNGEDLPEDQCIFIRGYRVARKLVVLPRGLKAAAGPNADPKGDEYEPNVELTSIQVVPEYRDPLNMILDYIMEEAPNCDMALVHDDDLAQIDGLGDDTSLETLEPDAILRHLRSSATKPKVRDVPLGAGELLPDTFSSSSIANADVETPREATLVATLSSIFEEPEPAPSRMISQEVSTFNTMFEVPPSQDNEETYAEMSSHRPHSQMQPAHDHIPFSEPTYPAGAMIPTSSVGGLYPLGPAQHSSYNLQIPAPYTGRTSSRSPSPYPHTAHPPPHTALPMDPGQDFQIARQPSPSYHSPEQDVLYSQSHLGVSGADKFTAAYQRHRRNLQRKYIDLINEASSKWANWDPPRRLQPGDFGTIVKSTGEFMVEGNIYVHGDLAHISKTYPPFEEDELDRYHIHSYEVRVDDAGGVGANILDAQGLVFRTHWQFNSKRGAVLLMYQPRLICVPDALFNEIRNAPILKNKSVVYQVFNCPGFYMYLSNKVNERVAVSLRANLPPQVSDVNPASGVGWMAHGTTGISQQGYHSSAIYTPLFSLRSLRKGYLRRVGESDEEPTEQWDETGVPWEHLDDDGMTDAEDSSDDDDSNDDDSE